MLITEASLNGLRTTLSTIFINAYSKGQEPFYTKLATPVPGKGNSNLYGWIAKTIRMREWIGPRIAVNVSEHAYRVPHKPFEGTIEVDRDEIEDDDIGMYTSMLTPQLGAAAKEHPNELLKAVLRDDDTLLWDGKTLFASDHPTFATAEGAATTYDNDFALELTEENFNTVWSTMVAYVGEDGLPLKVRPNTLIVPPQLERAARKIMNATNIVQTVSDGGNIVAAVAVDNVMKGWANVEVWDELSDEPTNWYLADTSKVIKPFVYQLRRAAQFVERFNPEDPKVFDLRVFTYGVDGRWNIAPTLPFLIARSKP